MQDGPKPPQTDEVTSFPSVFPSLSNAELLWRAKYLAPSIYLKHLPFLFWLVSDIRPKEVLTLGLTDGVAHFAVCQAIERRGGSAFCRGIRFEGLKDADEKSEKRAAIDRYNETNYADFSVIENRDEASAHEGIETGSIDLLLLEQFPSPTLLPLFEDYWMPKLGHHGIILIPGTSDKPLDDDAQVWIDGLCKKHSNINFMHGGGLNVVVMGDGPSERLKQLIQLARTNSNHRHIQHFFERIAQLHSLEMNLDETTEAAATAEQNALNNRNWAMRLQGEKDELTEAYDARHEAASQVQAELFDRSEETEKLRQQLEADQQEAKRVEADYLETEAALTTALQEQSNEADKLRQRLEAGRKEAEQFKADHLKSEAALTTALEEQSNEITELRQHLEAGLNEAEQFKADHLKSEAALTIALEDQFNEAIELRQQLEADHLKSEAALTTALEEQSNEAAELRQQLEADHLKSEAALTIALEERSNEITELRQQLEAGHKEAEQLKADHLKSETALTTFLQEQSNEATELRQLLEAERKEVEQFKADRFEEIAALTTAMERQSNEMTELRKQLETRRKDAETQKAG